jgi:hypothetical protein
MMNSPSSSDLSNFNPSADRDRCAIIFNAGHVDNCRRRSSIAAAVFLATLLAEVAAATDEEEKGHGSTTNYDDVSRIHRHALAPTRCRIIGFR